MSSVSEGFDLDAWLAQRRAEIDSLLDARLPAYAGADDPGRLVEAMRYALLAPGKRLRPLLALGAAEAIGAPLAMPIRIAACSIELVHCYSLIHDDLPAMDDDDFRRGRPSCHKAFDEATAILAGDALLTLAFEWLGDAGLLAVRESGEGRARHFLAATVSLGEAAGMRGMVRGQARDLGESPPSDLAALEELHLEKTGALFRASVDLGAMAAGADAESLADLRRFAEAFGLAFQHADDIDDREHGQHAPDARRRIVALGDEATAALARFGARAAPLRSLIGQLVARAST